MKNKKRFYPVEWMQKVSGVYQIKNKVNKKIYIGSSTNIYQRWKQHICAFSNNSLSGRNPNIFCKNGKKFDYLLNMDKEEAQKILNSKKENKVKIIGGTTYE